jgi:hypothetical protein
MQKIASTLTMGHKYQKNAELDSITISLLHQNIIDLKLNQVDFQKALVLKEDIIILKEGDIIRLQKALKQKTRAHKLTKIGWVATSIILGITLVSCSIP